MDDTPDTGGRLPPDLALLKWLVIGLTATMLAGLAVVVWLLATRLPAALGAAPPALPALPAAVSLPEGAVAEAVTFGRGWVAVVTGGGEILVFDAASGALRQRLAIGGTGPGDSP